MSCIVLKARMRDSAVSDNERAWLWRIAAAILILNLFDGAMTIAIVQTGLASEANPLMGELIGRGAVPFMFFKTALVSLSVLLLWRLRRLRSACLAMYAGGATYALVAVYHLRSLDLLAHFSR